MPPRLSEELGGSLTVPDGHAVTVWPIEPEPVARETNTGWRLLDFGPSGEFEALTAHVLASTTASPVRVLCVLQLSALAEISRDADRAFALMRALHALRALCMRTGGALVVSTADEGAAATAVPELLASSGIPFALQEGGANAVFVEIRRPDGSTTPHIAGVVVREANDLILLAAHDQLDALLADRANAGRARDAASALRERIALAFRAAPLSESIARFGNSETDENFERVLDIFVRSQLGVAATTGGLGSTEVRGEPHVLAFADPRSFLRNYGPRFNALVSGPDLMKAVIADPDCRGVRLNSALDQVSFVIPRIRVERELGRGETSSAPQRRRPPRPWWKFW